MGGWRCLNEIQVNAESGLGQGYRFELFDFCPRFPCCSTGGSDNIVSK